MNSRRFHEVGMKKCQVGNEEMEAEFMQEAMQELRIFAMACENFARIAKIS